MEKEEKYDEGKKNGEKNSGFVLEMFYFESF